MFSANLNIRSWTSIFLGPALALFLGSAFINGSAYADHTTEHVVENLKGGLGALELRVWNCGLCIRFERDFSSPAAKLVIFFVVMRWAATDFG